VIPLPGKQYLPGVHAPKVLHGEAPRGASTQSKTRGIAAPAKSSPHGTYNNWIQARVRQGRVGYREPQGLGLDGAVGAQQLGCWPSSCRMSRAGRPPAGRGSVLPGPRARPGVPGLVKAGRQQARTTTCNMRRRKQRKQKGGRRGAKKVAGREKCMWS